MSVQFLIYPDEGPLFFCSTKKVQGELERLHLVHGCRRKASQRVFFTRHLSQLRLALVRFLRVTSIIGCV